MQTGKVRVILDRSQYNVALIGNPNTGKSTLFSALAGIRQRVGNYPGVTVEKKTGRMDYDGCRYQLIDLPGLYSLSPRSRDEMVSVDVLLGRGEGMSPVDAVVCIVDAGNLKRNLYLVSQVLELGVPTVVALNMLDVAGSRGITVDARRSRPPAGHSGRGDPGESPHRAGRAQGGPGRGRRNARTTCGKPVAGRFPGGIEASGDDSRPGRLPGEYRPVGAAFRGPAAVAGSAQLPAKGAAAARGGRTAAGAGSGAESPGGGRLRRRRRWRPRPATPGRSRCSTASSAVLAQHVPTRSDRIDRLLTHRVGGTLILALVMFPCFRRCSCGPSRR